MRWRFSSLPLALFRPRVGIEQVSPDHARFRKPIEEEGRVLVVEADIGKTALVDPGQGLGHAVQEGLDADKPGFGVFLGFSKEMLAAAEADFQADLAHFGSEQGAQVPGRGCRKVELELGKERLEPRGLTGPQRFALAAAEEGAPRRVSGIGRHGLPY
jgi:hypothetical protein